MGDELRWFALKIFYNRVFQAEELFRSRGVECYLPLRWVEVEQGGRTIRRREPAVSSLLFVRTGEHDLATHLSEVGARVSLMPYYDREARKPAVIPDREMGFFILVTSTEDAGLEYLAPEDRCSFAKGDRVEVIDGPYRGAEGYIRRIRGNKRLLVSVEGVVAVVTTYIPGSFLRRIE